MDKCFIAINGDDVGKGIGNAVASDDYKGLSKLSQNIKNSHKMIEDWVQSQGGEIITSNGDEGLYSIPSGACSELENIKSQYQQMSQNTLTIGVGSSMSEASKALIYGKLNEKNQIVEYFPEIESYLSDEDEEDIPEDELPETDDIGDERDSELEEEAGISEEGQEEFPPEEGELDPDIIEDDEENVDNALPEDASPEELDAEDGEEFEDDGESFEDDGDELQPEDVANGNLDEDDQEGEEGNDRYNMLQDMIHGHLDEDGDGVDNDEEYNGDEEDAVNEELKRDIFNALQGFKNNKEMLEQAKQENPELYQSLITMLRSMIQMAKQVNYNPEEDLDEAEVQQGIEDSFPEAGDAEDGSEDFEDDGEEFEDDDGEEDNNGNGIDDNFEDDSEDFVNKDGNYDDKDGNGVDDDEEEFPPKKPFSKSEKFNKNPKDSKIHGLAGKIGIGPDELEENIYKVLSNLVNKKKGVKKKPENKVEKALPPKSTKHISRKQAPIGAERKGKIKIIDGDTGTISWRQVRTGMSRDDDGDPIAHNRNYSEMKPRPHHKAHIGQKKKGMTPHMGFKDTKEGPEEQ
jgi:hypothetical protein